MDGSIPSSHGSATPTNTNTMSSDANTVPINTHRDMAWEWGECRDPVKKQCVWCKLCGHKMSGGITRLKQHLTHTGGQVKGCPRVTVEISKKVMATIKEKEKIQLEKKRNLEILRAHTIDISDEDENDKVRQDFNLYIDSVGQFGSAAGIRGRMKVAPYIWWRTYGIDTPLLQRFAMSVLSQTSSASPCERNWSTFDNLHSKKRNCLLQQKLNDLVFIQYNTRLQRRFNSLKGNRSLDPILLRDVEENDDWVIPTETELEEFVDGSDGGLLWSVAREVMGGNEEVGPSTRSKRERYRDDDDDITVQVEDLDEQLDGLVDVDSEEDYMTYD